MSSLTQALSIALSGLRTSTSLINLASNNISNAQTPGYTAKSATVTSVEYGTQQGGSTMNTFTGVTDTALQQNYNAATSSSSYYTSQNGYMTQIQSILGSSQNPPPLTNDISNFASAWNQYSSNPESSITANTVVNAGVTLTQQIQSVSSQVGTLNSQVQSDIQNGVATLNSDLQQIATLNSQIKDASASGQPIADLQDKLNVAITAVSQFAQVSIQSRSNNQVAVYTTSGQPLVDGGLASTYSYSGGKILDQNGNDITSTLQGGSLQAQLDFVSTSSTAASSTTPGVGVIAKLQAQLSTLVNAFTASKSGSSSAFVTAYSNAVTASTGSGDPQNGSSVASNFFTVTNDGNGNPDPSTFQVASALVSGSSVLPQTLTVPIASSFDSTASYSTSGLNAANVTYEQLGTSILSSFQEPANSISSQNTTATSLTNYYKTQLSNETGVNLDNELASLTIYQNSYAASAHVISTVNAMLTTLMSIIPTS